MRTNCCPSKSRQPSARGCATPVTCDRSGPNTATRREPVCCCTTVRPSNGWRPMCSPSRGGACSESLAASSAAWMTFDRELPRRSNPADSDRRRIRKQSLRARAASARSIPVPTVPTLEWLNTTFVASKRPPRNAPARSVRARVGLNCVGPKRALLMRASRVPAGDRKRGGAPA